MERSALIILDGLGISQEKRGNAITRRTMPFLHSLMDDFGVATLDASGKAVGLDEGQTGNSEVGHLTIGAGRLVPSTMTRIRNSFDIGEWFCSPVWEGVKKLTRIHIAGLLSDAGVHAHWSSIVRTATLAAKHGIPQVYLHLFLDGVDSPAGSAPGLLAELNRACDRLPNVRIATVSGRKWACDRSGDRAVSDHCRAGLFGALPKTPFTLDALQSHLATKGSEAGFPFHYSDADGAMNDGDSVILTHHRTDRTRQLATSLKERANVYSLVQVDGVLSERHAFFPTQKLAQGLMQTLADRGIAAARVSESCKFSHVTHFINGMRDDIAGRTFEIPSFPEREIPDRPEMRLQELQGQVERLLESSDERALVINIPNLDQVGHTGSLALTEKAASLVDRSLHAVYEKSSAMGWNLVITADHGNADRMLDEAGRPLGSHSANPVPFIVITADRARKRLKRATGTLANVAATFLATLGLPAPSDMDESLIDVIKEGSNHGSADW